MIEHVFVPDEFKSLTKGRTHWTIEREPQRISNLNGGGVMQTGEHRLILRISGLSKKKPKHVVSLRISFGVFYPNQPEYNDKWKEIETYATTKFPDATKGGFE